LPARPWCRLLSPPPWCLLFHGMANSAGQRWVRLPKGAGRRWQQLTATRYRMRCVLVVSFRQICGRFCFFGNIWVLRDSEFPAKKRGENISFVIWLAGAHKTGVTIISIYLQNLGVNFATFVR